MKSLRELSDVVFLQLKFRDRESPCREIANQLAPIDQIVMNALLIWCTTRQVSIPKESMHPCG